MTYALAKHAGTMDYRLKEHKRALGSLDGRSCNEGRSWNDAKVIDSNSRLEMLPRGLAYRI